MLYFVYILKIPPWINNFLLYCIVLCCAVLCCAVLCCAVLCCAVLCCAVLCCAVLCCVVLICTFVTQSLPGYLSRFGVNYTGDSHIILKLRFHSSFDVNFVPLWYGFIVIFWMIYFVAFRTLHLKCFGFGLLSILILAHCS